MTSKKKAQLQTGKGEWTYQLVPDWGLLPEGKAFGGTHGGIATDNAGLVYVSTQSATGILVYSQEGVLLKTIAQDYPEVHSMVHAEESGKEYFYATVQTGTPQENWLFLKMTLDGTVVQKITAPQTATATPASTGLTKPATTKLLTLEVERLTAFCTAAMAWE